MFKLITVIYLIISVPLININIKHTHTHPHTQIHRHTQIHIHVKHMNSFWHEITQNICEKSIITRNVFVLWPRHKK